MSTRSCGATGVAASSRQSCARSSSMRIRLSSSGRPAALRERWLTVASDTATSLGPNCACCRSTVSSSWSTLALARSRLPSSPPRAALGARDGSRAAKVRGGPELRGGSELAMNRLSCLDCFPCSHIEGLARGSGGEERKASRPVSPPCGFGARADRCACGRGSLAPWAACPSDRALALYWVDRHRRSRPPQSLLALSSGAQTAPCGNDSGARLGSGWCLRIRAVKPTGLQSPGSATLTPTVPFGKRETGSG
jgi:hypothetical protein